ncbi:MAG: TonB-dependent receptor [Deltaproteobacteria bacterium]|nr:TonB-dependent receptor [Deltaproteobacteria bacterium]
MAPIASSQDESGLEDEFALLEEELAADEVESASKHRQSIFWSPSAITVLQREDIRSSGAVTIADLLRRVPGFDIYEMKPSFPLVGARALTEPSNNLVLVLVDGREALMELIGFPIWVGLTIDLEDIERIEIIRGPGSTLFGANAFAAVINITTMTERPASTREILITGGEVGYHNLYGRVQNAWTLTEGTLSFGASIGNYARLSPSDKNAVEMLSQKIRSHGYLRYQLGNDLDVSLHGGVMTGDGYMYLVFGDFIDQNVLNHYITVKTEIGLSDNLRLKAQVYHIRFSGDFHYRSTLRAFGQWLANIPDFFVTSDTVDTQLQVDWRASDWLHLVGGMNFRYNTMDSETITSRNLTEMRGAGFLQAQLQPWDILQLTAGLRVDLNDRTDPAFSPRVALVLRPTTEQAVRLSYGLAFRKPAFIENQMHMKIDEYAFDAIVNKIASAIGNENLVNEQVHSIEVGWRAHFMDDRLKVSVESFFNLYQNMIYFKRQMALDSFGAPNIPDSDYQFENADGNVYAAGGEAELSWSLSDRWRLWGNIGLRWVTDDDFVRLESEPILRTNLGGRWNSVWGIYIDLALHYVSSYNMPMVLPDKTFEETTDIGLGNRWLLIGRVGYRIIQDQTSQLELGFTARAPLGAPFREYPGLEIEPSSRSTSSADWAGEKLVRWISFYLRGAF